MAKDDQPTSAVDRIRDSVYYIAELIRRKKRQSPPQDVSVTDTATGVTGAKEAFNSKAGQNASQKAGSINSPVATAAATARVVATREVDSPSASAPAVDWRKRQEALEQTARITSPYAVLDSGNVRAASTSTKGSLFQGLRLETAAVRGDADNKQRVPQSPQVQQVTATPKISSEIPQPSAQTLPEAAPSRPWKSPGGDTLGEGIANRAKPAAQPVQQAFTMRM